MPGTCLKPGETKLETNLATLKTPLIAVLSRFQTGVGAQHLEVNPPPLHQRHLLLLLAHREERTEALVVGSTPLLGAKMAVVVEEG